MFRPDETWHASPDNMLYGHQGPAAEEPNVAIGVIHPMVPRRKMG